MPQDLPQGLTFTPRPLLCLLFFSGNSQNLKFTILKPTILVLFTIIVLLCDSHLYLVSKHFHHPERNLVSIKQSHPLPLTCGPGNHQSDVYLSLWSFYSLHREHRNCTGSVCTLLWQESALQLLLSLPELAQG